MKYRKANLSRPGVLRHKMYVILDGLAQENLFGMLWR